MSLIPLIVVILVVAVLLWVLNAYVPLQQPLKTIINVLVLVVLLLWILRVFGLLSV